MLNIHQDVEIPSLDLKGKIKRVSVTCVDALMPCAHGAHGQKGSVTNANNLDLSPTPITAAQERSIDIALILSERI